jgi:hypothetical protein
MAVTQANPVPYAPTSAVMEIISRRRHRSLPLPINADVLARASISPSLIPRTLQALQTLDLIDEAGNPTPIFEAIRTSPEADYQRRLEEWLKGAYSEVFSFVDPATDDDVRIRDAFRNYNPPGQHDRMVSLFVGLCSAAGIMPEKAATPRATRPSTPRPASPKPTATPRRPPPEVRPSPSFASDVLPLALTGLLAAIPAAERGWTKSDRDQFYATFGTVLDFCIPIRTEAQLENSGDDGQG